MEVEKQIKAAIKDMSPGESLRTLGTLIETVMSVAEESGKGIRQTASIPIGDIDLFPNHPFYVETDDDMNDLVKSIKKYGMITPGAVREKDNGRYELLSGHRRLWACKLAGIDEFRCEVLDLTDDEAVLFMIEANRQRTRMHPCEKGQIYKLRQKYMDPYSNLQDIRIEAEDTPRRINAYVRLSDLIPELQDLVDEGRMSLGPASALSCLPHKYQRLVLDRMEYEQCSPSHEQTRRMKRLNDDKSLTPEKIIGIMEEIKPNQKAHIVLRDEKTLSYIPSDLPVSKQEEYIAKALEFYEKAGGNDGKRNDK